MLMRSGSRPSSRCTAMELEAKASFTSMSSMSLGSMPCLAATLGMDQIGATSTYLGSIPAAPWAPTLTRGSSPAPWPCRPLITTTAAAPSLRLEALPAVTLPSFLNTVRREPSLSRSGAMSPSSRLTTLGLALALRYFHGHDLASKRPSSGWT